MGLFFGVLIGYLIWGRESNACRTCKTLRWDKEYLYKELSRILYKLKQYESKSKVRLPLWLKLESNKHGMNASDILDVDEKQLPEVPKNPFDLENRSN